MAKEIIHIGMGGWDLPPFHRSFYPPHPPRTFRKLEFYSRYFDCVEVNATFYNTSLNSKHALRWIRDVEGTQGFEFSVKLFRGFTHSRTATLGDYRATCRLLDTLNERGKLHGLVIQFPYSFTETRERRSYLIKLSEAFRQYSLFLDVRHDSWNVPSLHRFYEDHRIHLINIDLPRIKRHMPFQDLVWGGQAYFRLMGRNRETWNHPERGDRYLYRYSLDELRELTSLILRVHRDAQSTFVVFHNDPEANSLINGFQLRHLLSPSSPVWDSEKLVLSAHEDARVGFTGSLFPCSS